MCIAPTSARVLTATSLLLSLANLPCFAQAEVYSVNVVGFQKLTAVTGLTLVATPFSKTSNTLDGVVGAQLTAGKTAGQADNISIWNPVSQAYETYWLKTSDSNWYTSGGVKATNRVTPLQGMFITNRRPTNQIVVVSGDVPTQNRATNSLLPGLNLVSYPFSADIDINQSYLTNGKTGKVAGTADNILIWNPTTRAYEAYWLKSDKKWYTSSGVLASNVRVGAGKGFWYLNRTNVVFAWVEPRPYTF